MKTKLKLAVVLLAVSTLNSQLSTAHAQGSLTPPGAPAPTMKTLDQLEPRTPISAAPFTISQPGSYYLTGNLTITSGDAITIATNSVTLDLNGFTISSTAASAAGCGILLSGSNPRDLTILNGHITGGVTNNGSGVYSGSGFANGIYFSVNPPVNVLVSKVSVSGCLIYGIALATVETSVVEGCTARTIGSYGIFASTVKSCGAAECGSYAIYGDQVSDCRGAATGGGIGISASGTALNCYGYSTGGSGNGISAATALNCHGYCVGNGYGLSAGTAQNCYGSATGNGIGLSATTAQNCYGYITGNGIALSATTAQNCVGLSAGTSYGLLADIASNCRGVSGTGVGLRFTQLGAMCYGSRTSPVAQNYVIGSGLAGPINLP